ncbi:AbiJ-related protein [Streptomyces anulatus]|uniref:AbiJ-related protein n=1 Tax=Streptomyces anulatus TaxID=1892 RepID=UPI00369B78E1
MAMHPTRLREAVDAVVWGLQPYSHRQLTELGAAHGLPMPRQDAGSKSQRLEACLAAITDDELQQVAQRLLKSPQISVRGAERFALEDAVWELGPVIEILGRVRRDVAQAIDLSQLIHSQDRFEQMLDRFWVLDNDPVAIWTGSSRTSRRALIHQYVFRNPGDWSAEDLFENLGVYEAGSTRFSRFLEGLVDPASLPDAAAQQRIVEMVNPELAAAGIRLERAGDRDGYPYFQLVRIGPGIARRPKTLVFATTVKPDIRLASVVDNSVEVLQGADHVLVYDLPVGPDGLRWHNLQQWWQEKNGIGNEKEAKRDLYNRLLRSMPDDNVSPQRDFFRCYHEIHGARVSDLPALLPEVWLHWDHKTVQQRGVQALTNHRMDFLLLLPNNHRVVLEIDGRHHYANSEAYEKTVRGDRSLKLRGYEVYRFSSTELNQSQLGPLLEQFFTDLFDRYA